MEATNIARRKCWRGRISPDVCDHLGPVTAESITTCFPLWSIIPFIAMLLSIAVVPMVLPNWWDSNRNKTIVSVVLSLPVLAIVFRCEPGLLKHSLLDYFSFLS